MQIVGDERRFRNRRIRVGRLRIPLTFPTHADRRGDIGTERYLVLRVRRDLSLPSFEKRGVGIEGQHRLPVPADVSRDVVVQRFVVVASLDVVLAHLLNVIHVPVEPDADAMASRRGGQAVAQFVACAVEGAGAARIAAEIPESGDDDPGRPHVRDLFARVGRDLATDLIQQARAEHRRQPRLHALARALAGEIGRHRLIELQGIEIEVLTAQMRVGALHVQKPG